MPVTILTENQQAAIVSLYNRNKKSYETIPLVPRNQESGWPLLQVSLFSLSASATEPDKFGHALSGGTCRSMNIGAFNLASLLAKLPGRIDIELLNGEKLKRDEIRVECIGKFMEGYQVFHRQSGVSLSSSRSAYGEYISVGIPDADTNAFESALNGIFSFAQLGSDTIPEYSRSWGDTRTYTAEEIQTVINNEVAVFTNGQIFIDLGAFLERSVNNAAITAYFKAIFKVDDFLTLWSGTPSLPATMDTKLPIELNLLNEESPLERSLQIKKLRNAIDNLRFYGDRIMNKESGRAKGRVALALACVLHHQVSQFVQNAEQHGLTSELYETFKANFKAKLHTKDHILSEHRAYSSVVLKNILIALTGIGTLLVLGKMFYSYVNTGKAVGFFDKTCGHQRVNDIDDDLESIQVSQLTGS